MLKTGYIKNDMPYYLGLSLLSTKPGRGLSAKAGAEARYILSRFSGRPLEESDIAREGQGRPFFPGSEADFNIAHCGSLAVVSYVQGGNLRTGCDVERVRPRARMREIAEDFFSDRERNYIFSQDRFKEARFYEIWTLKECFLKLRGLSVFDMPACPSFIGAQGRFVLGDGAAGTPAPSPLSFYLYELTGGAGVFYMLATAIEGTEQQPPELRWFSQPSLTCKKTAEIKAAPSPAETVMPNI